MLGLILCRVVQIYGYIIVARVVISFIPLFKPDWSPSPGLRPILEFIYGLTDPPVNYLRRFIPQPMGFPFDLSFLVWILLINFVIAPILCRL
jgi:YggT family protein